MLKLQALTVLIAVVIMSIASHNGGVQALPLPGCFGGWCGGGSKKQLRAPSPPTPPRRQAVKVDFDLAEARRQKNDLENHNQRQAAEEIVEEAEPIDYSNKRFEKAAGNEQAIQDVERGSYSMNFGHGGKSVQSDSSFQRRAVGSNQVNSGRGTIEIGMEPSIEHDGTGNIQIGTTYINDKRVTNPYVHIDIVEKKPTWIQKIKNKIYKVFGARRDDQKVKNLARKHEKSTSGRSNITKGIRDNNGNIIPGTEKTPVRTSQIGNMKVYGDVKIKTNGQSLEFQNVNMP